MDNVGFEKECHFHESDPFYLASSMLMLKVGAPENNSDEAVISSLCIPSRPHAADL